MTAAPSWPDLVSLLVHGPDLPMRGRIRHREAEGGDVIAWARIETDPDPVLARGSADVVDAWCWGQQLRLTDPDGRLRLICDDTTAWSFDEPREPPRESPRRQVEFGLGGTELLVRATAERWLGDDFTRPTGPAAGTTFLGRDAWTVELASPAHKPHPIQLIVDAETGMLLQLRNDYFGMVSEWTDLVVGVEIDPALFTWDGPVVTWDEQRAQRRREIAAEEHEHEQRALEHLGTRTLNVTLEVGVRVHEVGEDGSLHASLSHIGSLMRRPRSDAPWDDLEQLRGGPPLQRWSEGRWDWALAVWDEPLATGALTDLQAQLGRLSPD